ncbi:MFS transporter [Aeromicrobium alkaliterrae]|uniref:MFS transporter n=1 Tax=Aeromicrobium alkaliterrae TaxID=302168 RepID=A0ABN2K6K9_9ACTN
MSQAPRAGLLPVVAAGTALVLVTYVTPLATLPPTIRDLGGGSAAQAWILSAMSIGLAGGMLATGVLGDRYGRRRIYLLGLTGLVVGAVLAAAAWHPGVMITARVVEGVGGGAILACGLAVLAQAHPPGPALQRATATWGASIGGGIAGGALLSAALDIGTSWRENYVVTAVAGLVLLLPTARIVPESRSATPRRLDVPGMVLLALVMVAAVGALTQARSGWGALSSLLVGVAVVAFVALGLTERRTRQPLVDPDLLQRPRFLASILGSLTVGLSIIAMSSFLPTVAQAGYGDSLRVASIPPFVWAVASTLSAILLRRLPVSPQGPGAISVLLLLQSAAMLLALLADSSVGLVLPMALAGVATGLLNAVLGREAVVSVPLDQAAMASGASNTARYLGAACGITLVVVIGTRGSGDVLAGWHLAVLAAAALGVLGSAVIGAIALRARGAARADGVVPTS